MLVSNQPTKFFKMKKLSQDFNARRVFDVLSLLAFVICLGLFVKSIIAIMSAFESQVYTNAIAELVAI